MPDVKDKVVFDYGGKTLISLAPDRNRLCVANKHGLTKVLKTNNPEEEPEVLETLKRLSFIRCDNSNGFILGTTDGDVMRYNYETGGSSLVVRFALPVRDCCIVHSGKMGVFGGDDLELSLIELFPQDTNPQRYKIKLDEQVHQLSYSPGTNLLSVSMINAKIQFYSLNSTQPNKVYELTDEIPRVAYEDVVGVGVSVGDHNGLLSDILSSDSETEETEQLGDDSLGKRSRDPEFTKENRLCTRVAWHPTGLYFAIPSKNGLIKLYSIKNYSQLKVLKAETSTGFTNLEFEPVYGNALVATDLNNKVTVWDWQNSKVVYTKDLKVQITNLVWKCQPDTNKETGKYTMDLIMGSWSGSTVTISGLEDVMPSNIDSKKPDKAVAAKLGSDLFVDEDPESDFSYSANDRLGLLVDRVAEEDNNKREFLSDDDDDDNDLFNDKLRNVDGIGEGDDDDGLFTQNRDQRILKRKREFGGSGYDDDGFVDDDDGMGYAEPHIHRRKTRNTHGMGVSSLLISGPGKFHYKPFSPGATPFGGNDRRYLTMNSIGYVSTVKNNEQHSITVSFFDIGKYNEYHFEDLFGYDVCSLTELGTLYAHSKLGQIYYRPHDSIYSSWTKLVPLKSGERITAIAATPKRVIVGTSLGYVRFFNPYGLPISIEKMSPVVAVAAQEYRVFVVHYSPYHGISYSLLEYSPDEKFTYFQKEAPLPLALPRVTNDGSSATGIEDIDKDIVDMEYEVFNPLGIKNMFFSAYGDPCIFGYDNVLLILSKWRSLLESRWIPILDTDFEIWKMAGGKDSSDVHAWPLGLNYDTLSCILVKGKRFWPEFPLPLPSEMEVRVPVLVKSQLLEENKALLQEDNTEKELNGGIGDDDTGEGINEDDKLASKELEVPVSMAAEEEFIRSKVLSSLLRDTLENDGEIYGNERDILASLSAAYDKSLLRLFAVACTNQDSDRAMSIVRELKQDRALAAAAKIAERAEMLTVMKRVNDLREAMFAREHNGT